MSDRPQSYANHRAHLPPGYSAAYLAIFANLGWAGWQVTGSFGIGTAIAFALAAALLVTHFSARRSAQIVQDRLIRLEMRLRLERLLPGRDDWKRLDLPQIIALRFAGDGELPTLIDRTVRGELATPGAIKRAITDWQPDWLRV